MPLYIDAHGTWDAVLDGAGKFLYGSLVLPSAAFEAARAAHAAAIAAEPKVPTTDDKLAALTAALVARDATLAASISAQLPK